MAKQSLFSACKRVFRDGISGTYTVGTKDIFLELYGQDDIDNNNEIGNSSEENIVVVAGNTITIPSGYTLTPVKPKKSLVIICNTFVNNGTVSMYQKAPNVLPHDLFIIEKKDYGGMNDIIIPAYANNGKTISQFKDSTDVSTSERNGQNGSDRSCGSGGFGATIWGTVLNIRNGSGYAFGGGAGTGGVNLNGKTQEVELASVSSEYPMRGGDYCNLAYSNYFTNGGVGNPSGKSQEGAGGYSTYAATNFGCGGRIIIFCGSFTNNGTITVNGSNVIMPSGAPAANNNNHCDGLGGASGAGAVDVFYANKISEGNITANGGQGGYVVKNDIRYYTGSGGNGSITLTEWPKSSILKPVQKYMSKANMIYFLTEYISRLKQGED